MAITISSPNITTTNPADFANSVQAYYEPKLFKALEYELILGSYGWKKAIPASGNNGTIRFFRPRAANRTGVQAISEGVPPTTLTEVARGYVDISISQRGALAKITDIVQARDLIDTLDLYTRTMGADAALDYDSIIRAAIATGLKTYNTANSNALYGTDGYFERFGTVTPTADPAADWVTLAAAATSASKMTRILHLGTLTTLKSARVPTIGGRYVAAIAPEVMHDIRQDTTWLNSATQVNTNALYKRASIELDGGVFVEHNNAHREAVGGAYGTYAATGGIFSCFYFGDGAFGVPSLDNSKAGSNPAAPSLIVITKADKADPLAQWVSVGWKSYYGSGLLVTNVSGDIPHIVNLRVKSTHN